MGSVGLLYVGAVLFINGLFLLGVIPGKSAGILNFFVGGMQVIFPPLIILGADGDQATIFGASGLYLFGFTYLYVALLQFTGVTGEGLGWFSIFVTGCALFIGFLQFPPTGNDPVFGVIWLIWAVLSFLFFLVLALGRALALALGLGLAWPGFWGTASGRRNGRNPSPRPSPSETTTATRHRPDTANRPTADGRPTVPPETSTCTISAEERSAGCRCTSTAAPTAQLRNAPPSNSCCRWVPPRQPRPVRPVRARPGAV